MDVLNHLRQLIFRLNRDDVTTVHALIKRITGDQVAAVMLARLLYWLPKSQTGWVFKSWRDWEAECGLTRAQIKRVHSSRLLEAVGVQRELRKACGAPTVHYHIDLDVFFEKISACLGTSVTEITNEEPAMNQPESAEPWVENRPMDWSESAQRIGSESPNGLVANDPMDWVESAQSITEINTQEEPTQKNNTDQQQQQAVAAAVDPYALDQLVRLGFTRVLAHDMLTQHGVDRIREVLERSRDTGIHNPAGFVRRALLENWIVKPQRPSLLDHDPMRYVTGKYAAFIEH